MSHRALSTLLFLAIVLPATAQATSREDKRAAATAFAKGKRLLQQSKSDEAVVALEEAVNLDPSGKYRIEYAKALVAQGSLQEALGTLSGIEEDPDKAAAKAGAKLAKDLNARVPALTVTLSNDIPGVVVKVDDQDIAVGEATRLNPGMHVVRIEQDGETKEERSVVLRERDKRAARRRDRSRFERRRYLVARSARLRHRWCGADPWIHLRLPRVPDHERRRDHVQLRAVSPRSVRHDRSVQDVRQRLDRRLRHVGARARRGGGLHVHPRAQVDRGREAQRRGEDVGRTGICVDRARLLRCSLSAARAC
jgi:tetratricopeptide (TPR) repeat protein